MPTSKRENQKKAVIEVLNQARAMELQAIHQYMNQHYNLWTTWITASWRPRSNSSPSTK